MDEVEYIAHKHLERDSVERSHSVGEVRCSTSKSTSEELSRSFIGVGDGRCSTIISTSEELSRSFIGVGDGRCPTSIPNDEVYRCQRRFL